MKKIAFITQIMFSFLFAMSQETSIINIGAGYPFFFESNFDENSGGSHSLTSDRFNVFIEVPQLIKFRKNPNFSITPGFGYFLFNEVESSGALGGRSNWTLKHQALSLYAKLNYSITSNVDKPFCWYAGILSGIYVHSKSKGDVNWWIMQQGSNYYGEYEINKNGNIFFNNFYNGFYAGFKIKTGFGGWVQPAFEFSFLPGYASITDRFLTYDSKDKSATKSIVMMSVIFGIGKKKATQING